MHTVIATALLCFAATGAFAETAGQVGPDPRYKIRLTIDGVAVKGSQELEEIMATKTTNAERDAVLDANPIPKLTRGQTSQLIVTVTELNGVKNSYTRGPRIGYETFNCVTISPDSVLTAVPSSPAKCRLPDNPGFFVYFNDANGKPISYSEFAFLYR